MQLHRQIYANLDHLFAYPNALPDKLQDVFQTIDNLELFPEVIAALKELDQHSTPSLTKEVAVPR